MDALTGDAAERMEPVAPVVAPSTPGPLAQTWTLLKRRAVLFKRDRGYWLLTLGITLGFPLLVTIFAWDGIPQLRGMALGASVGDAGLIGQMEASLRYRVDALEMASLVTGLILFQVILLTLMGSNNGAREIAAERQIFRERALRRPQCARLRFQQADFCLGHRHCAGHLDDFFREVDL